jgi:hypothetical protein
MTRIGMIIEFLGTIVKKESTIEKQIIICNSP